MHAYLLSHIDVCNTAHAHSVGDRVYSPTWVGQHVMIQIREIRTMSLLVD